MHTNRLEYRVEEDCKVGPVIEATARDAAMDAVASSDGGVLTGGKGLDAAGFNLAPTRTNAPTSSVEFHAPFGGSIASSFGPREQGASRG
jgi:alpha-ketoglutaric semialdehyde dehydrogenase